MATKKSNHESSLLLHESLKLSIREINCLDPLRHGVTPVNKFQVNRISQSIVVSVLCVIETNNEHMCKATLQGVSKMFILTIGSEKAQVCSYDVYSPECLVPSCQGRH